jgi:hypothetical protein
MIAHSSISAASLLSASQSLMAYLDPGSGSIIIQLIIAAAAGIAYTMRVQIGNFVRFVTGKSRKENSEESGNGEKDK